LIPKPANGNAMVLQATTVLAVVRENAGGGLTVAIVGAIAGGVTVPGAENAMAGFPPPRRTPEKTPREATVVPRNDRRRCGTEFIIPAVAVGERSGRKAVDTKENEDTSTGNARSKVERNVKEKEMRRDANILGIVHAK
jgi:hypothetical protein